MSARKTAGRRMFSIGSPRDACHRSRRPGGTTVRNSLLSQQRPPGPKETTMKWQTPQATDLRFGFEITMYISAR